MKIMKVENISGFKLDFFLKQNKKDIRVVLGPGESTWCDEGSTTKSMILYERKSLIKTSSEEMQNFAPPITEEDRQKIKEYLADPTRKERMKKGVEEFAKIEIKKTSQKTISEELQGVQPMTEPSAELFYLEPVYVERPSESALEKAQKEAEEYKQESVKKYKGKKRGRKKKRGPKPGSKKNKSINSLPTIVENKDNEATGNTSMYFSD
jgi:hypothetical protein